jgi:hypothetical protein
MSDIVDAEPVTGADVVPAAPSATLFRADDPLEVIDRAGRVADRLRDVLRQQHMVSTISGREHVRVEGWTTLGSMLGVVPVVEWTRPTADGWEARVEARTLDGRTVGAAEAMCSRSERTWSKRDDYALRSMAQTRATSKALRGPLGFVVTLAGFEATPEDEMPAQSGPAYGSPCADTKPVSDALTRLAGGDVDIARAVWRAITADLGYMPDAAARALVIAANMSIPDLVAEAQAKLGAEEVPA